MKNLKISDYCGGTLEVSQHSDGTLFIELAFRDDKQTFAIDDGDVSKLINHLQEKSGLPTYKQIAESVRDELLKDIPQAGSDADKYRYKIGQYILNVDVDSIIDKALNQ